MYRDDVDRLFADLFPGGRHGASNEARAPVDVYLTDGPPPSLTVELDIAGVDPARVDVALVEDVLVVRGERRRAGGGRRVYQHAEIAWGPFERRLRLGVSVDAAAASAASYETGILRILPAARAGPADPPGGHRRARRLLMAEEDVVLEVGEVADPRRATSASRRRCRCCPSRRPWSSPRRSPRWRWASRARCA